MPEVATASDDNRRPLISADEESPGKLLGKALVELLLRAVVVGFVLSYTMSFWLAYAHRPPSAWHWRYGFFLGLIPFHSGVLATRCYVLAAVGTFLASFFVL